jgi:tRNA threonylcarbamoyl adenosine modification protein (Sua5/YciO/YrdC/YwlC family)
MTVPDLIPSGDPRALAAASEALVAGAVVAIPTDTVYGLAVDPTQPEAVAALFALKERPAEVALPVLVGSRQQVDQVAAPLESAAAHLAARFWPGPLTLVVPRRRAFTADLGGPLSARQTVGVRWPRHPVVGELCSRIGPLAVTSANLHGHPPATSAADLVGMFGNSDDLVVIVDGGTCDGTPSTVVECRGPASRGLREGGIPFEEIFDRHPPRTTSESGPTG